MSETRWRGRRLYDADCGAYRGIADSEPYGDDRDKGHTVVDVIRPDGLPTTLLCGAVTLDEARLAVRRGCPDGGTCHHGCDKACWRVNFAEPLTAAGWGDQWPEYVKRMNSAVMYWHPWPDDDAPEGWPVAYVSAQDYEGLRASVEEFLRVYNRTIEPSAEMSKWALVLRDLVGAHGRAGVPGARRNGDEVAWVRGGAHAAAAQEIEKAHDVLDAHEVPRHLPESEHECALAARIELSLGMAALE